jgi:hypothetical protein
MSSLVHPQGLGGWQVASRAVPQTEIAPSQFFRSIPPERVGLNGEYDHSGLAKRVEQAFRQQFYVSELEHLRITQRGRVVILRGWVTDAMTLERLTQLALSISGTTAVETFGVAILPVTPARSPATEPQFKAIAAER